MRQIIFIVLLSIVRHSLADCNETQYEHEMDIMSNLGEEAGREAFLKRQVGLPQADFVTQCKKTGVELNKLWGQFEHVTPCQRVKHFVKKRLVLWDFFCTLDNDFRKNFDGGFFEKLEDCDKQMYKICIKEGADYCDPKLHDELFKCLDNDLKGKCTNYNLFDETVHRNQKFLMENGYCGKDHPAALNHYEL